MSRNHIRLDPRRWARARKAALARAGHRSELTGLAGRLEIHHRVRLEDGGDPYDLDNLVVVTRDEHIRLHEADNITPGRLAWRRLVAELLAE